MSRPPYAVVFTFRSEHDLTALVFCAAVDSARARLQTSKRAIPVILVDDCSPGAAWQAALVEYEKIGDDVHVLRMGVSRAHSALVPGAVPGGAEPSFGHGPALDLGLWWAKHRLGCSRVLVLDGDAIIMADDAGAQLDAALPLLDGTTITVGDWVGTPENWRARPQTADAYWHTTPAGRSAKAECPQAIAAPIRAYGYDPLICSLVDLDAFWSPGIGCLQNTGWVANVWYYTQVAQGKRSGYAPFFRGGLCAHLGHTAVSASRGWDRPFGNVRGQRYAGKEFGTYHAGYLQIVSVEALIIALGERRPGEPLAAGTLFAAPYPPEVFVPPPPHLRYRDPLDRLDVDQQVIEFEYVHGKNILARATVTLDGDVCRIEAIEGPSLVACFAEICEHAVAMLRVVVQAPWALYNAAKAERNAHAMADKAGWMEWGTPLHFVRSSPKHHRWAEHFHWEQYG